MHVLIALFSSFIYFVTADVGSFSQVISNGGRNKTLPAVDALISRLERERWKPDDEDCFQATLEMLRGVKNNTLWATWVWDSMQPPVGTFYGVRFHLGNYDQCLQAPWSSKREHDRNPGFRPQYCIVDVKSVGVEQIREIDPFESAEEYYRTPTKDRFFNEQSFGVCLPVVCRPLSVGRIFRHMHQLTHLPNGDVYVDPRDCQIAGVPFNSKGFYIFWLVVGMLLLTAVFSTFYNKGYTKLTSLDTIITSFCLKRNYYSLFKVNKDEIKVMNGMRFLSCACIVMVHEMFFTFQFPIVNSLYLEKTLYTTAGAMLAHSDVVADTFFTMSGILLIRGLMVGNQKNVLFTLVKRYIRLIGPFALCTLFMTTAIMTIDQGPLWSRIVRVETDICAQSWWKNLLMINTDVETLCHCVTWYISCDFQLAILATLLFWLFRRNRKLGVTCFVIVAVALTLNLGLLVYSKKLDIIPFSLKFLFTLRETTDLNYTYFKSYSRAGSYLVGMVMGYIVATYKPRDHRNAISKKWSIVATIVSLATMITVLNIGSIFAGRPYDPLQAAVVVATNRVVWAIAVCCLIGACEYGSVWLITSLLSWPGFVPLSKLSYGLYLLHTIVLVKQKLSAKSPVTFGIYNSFVNSQGVLVVGCALSFILYLILEAPFINISNALFSEKSRPLDKNDNSAIHQQNRHNGQRFEENTKAKIS